MPAPLIPLFPLQVVVFPRTRLPLHVFEERYKEMIGNAIRDHSEFGVVADGVPNHLFVSRFENVQWQPRSGKDHHLQGK